MTLEFIALDSVDAADRVLDEIETAINMLVSNPNAGHLRPDLILIPFDSGWSAAT